MQKQIIYIHGGDSFESYDDYIKYLKETEFSIDWFVQKKKWKMSLVDELGDEFQILMPDMPNKFNAVYEEWKIWFEKMIPFINDGVILIGHSQGGIFLAKYLSENNYPKKISALMLVAPVYNNTPEVGSFKLVGARHGAPLLDNVSKQCGNIHLFQSKDDSVVPFSESEEYRKELPDAKFHIFEDRGHFLQETFPEIIEEIKKIG